MTFRGRRKAVSYRRLPFCQYFIDNGRDYNHTGRVRREIDYKAVSYQCNGFERFLHFRHETNYEVFYEEDRGVIQINFQETSGFSDWFANIAEFGSRYYDAIDYDGGKLQLRAHHGWAEMYRAIKWEIRSAWQALHFAHPDAPTEIIGWSLGSGQAILCAQDLYYNFGLKAYVYTFGTVRPFRCTRQNRAETEKYLSEICAACWNFADVNDIISYMPPFFGFVMPRRVDVGTDKKRSFFRLLNPWRYHTHYDDPSVYGNKDGIPDTDKQEI